MDDLPIVPEYFDVVWSEGSIFVTGFETGLSYWKKFLKTGGSPALPEVVWFTDSPLEERAAFREEAYPVITSISGYKQVIEKSGYDLGGSISLLWRCGRASITLRSRISVQGWRKSMLKIRMPSP